MSCLFRSASAYDPRMHEGLRCPACERIHWVRDGTTVMEVEDGRILVEVIDTGQGQAGPWRCAPCGFAAAESSRSGRLLARALIASRFAALGLAPVDRV